MSRPAPCAVVYGLRRVAAFGAAVARFAASLARFRASIPAGAPIAVGVFAALLVAGCATGGGTGEEESGELVLVTVENRIVPRTALTVRIVSEAGVRSFLGRVSPQDTETFDYRRPAFSGIYQLVAETSDGSEAASRAFDLFTGAEVHWSLPSNALTVRLAEIEGGPEDRLGRPRDEQRPEEGDVPEEEGDIPEEEGDIPDEGGDIPPATGDLLREPSDLEDEGVLRQGERMPARTHVSEAQQEMPGEEGLR